jgi:diketogulonate reductase-like aldo/keto reductase
MAMNRSFKLNSGYSIPAVGLGTWQSGPNEVKEAVAAALKIGYRHIDAAAVYGNEAEVGQGIKASGVDRKDVFVRILPHEIVMNMADISIDYRKALEHRSQSRRCRTCP